MEAVATREDVVEEERDEDAEGRDGRQDVVVELVLDDAEQREAGDRPEADHEANASGTRVDARAEEGAAASAAGTSAAHSHMRSRARAGWRRS